jgi:hypothetical protein
MRLVTIIVALLGVLGTATTSLAQWAPAGFRPIRSVDRWLGIGWSGGYHWRNPGPNSDYYNPYNDQNSMSIGNTSAQNWRGTNFTPNSFRDDFATIEPVSNQTTLEFNNLAPEGTWHEPEFQDPGLTHPENPAAQSNPELGNARSIFENRVQTPAPLGHASPNGVFPGNSGTGSRGRQPANRYVSPFARHRNH